jgi:hypothetical protein
VADIPIYRSYGVHDILRTLLFASLQYIRHNQIIEFGPEVGLVDDVFPFAVGLRPCTSESPGLQKIADHLTFLPRHDTPMILELAAWICFVWYTAVAFVCTVGYIQL